jgi:hypothetical protein
MYRVIWWIVSYVVVYYGGLCFIMLCILVDCELTRHVITGLSFDTVQPVILSVNGSHRTMKCELRRRVDWWIVSEGIV